MVKNNSNKTKQQPGAFAVSDRNLIANIRLYIANVMQCTPQSSYTICVTYYIIDTNIKANKQQNYNIIKLLARFEGTGSTVPNKQQLAVR